MALADLKIRPEEVLEILISPFQPLEDAMQTILLLSADNATGDALTKIGKRVGREREGVTDDDIFRRYVRAQIKTNRSSGTGNELLAIADLIIGDANARTVLTFEGPATARLRVSGVAVTAAVGDVLAQFVSRAKAAGVRVYVQWSESAPAATFTFDIGPGFDVGHLASQEG
jgi:hypothetical protein